MKLISNLDKLGVTGIFITVFASPCCFPLFGFLLSAFGLGSAELFGGFTEYIFQGFVLLSLVGTFISYQNHKNILPLLFGLISSGAIFYAYNVNFDTTIIYAAMVGLLISAGFNYYFSRKQKAANCCAVDETNVELTSTITCPKCGHQKTETMPTNACTFFYECENCKERLKPKEGDCCVFCSYGSVKCPPIQQGKKCC